MAVAVAEVARHGIDGAGLELAAEDVHVASYAQPVTSQRPRRNRVVISPSRTTISTRSAAHTPRMPQSASSVTRSTRRATDEGHEHRQREKRPVARADEDPVEREDGAVQRLHEREDRPQERGLVEHRRSRP